MCKDGVFEKSYRPFSRPGLGGGGVGVIGGKGREVGVGWGGVGVSLVSTRPLPCTRARDAGVTMPPFLVNPVFDPWSSKRVSQ